MVYKLDPKIRPNPLLPWIYVFMCLSIKQFRQVYEKLDFPLDPPEAVRQLAHDFALTREIMSRNPEHVTALENLLRNGETVAVDLLKSTSPDDSRETRSYMLFTNTFAHLEHIGYGEVVYRWGKQTQDYYEFAHAQALHALCHLLRHWAVLEALKQPPSPEYEIYSIDWDGLVTKYAPIYANSKLALEPLPLSAESRRAIQAIVLYHETKKKDFQTTMDHVMSSTKSAWEEFALSVGTAGGSWIRLEARFRIDLREWNMLVDRLSSDEIHALQQWALEHKNRDHGPNFLRDLKILPPVFRDSSPSERTGGQ